MEITKELREKYKSLLDVKVVGVAKKLENSPLEIIETDEDLYNIVIKFLYKGYNILGSCQGHETPEFGGFNPNIIEACGIRVNTPYVKFMYDKETFIHLADYLHMAKDRLTIDVKTSNDNKIIQLKPVDSEIDAIKNAKDLDDLYNKMTSLRKCFSEIADAVPHIRGNNI